MRLTTISAGLLLVVSISALASGQPSELGSEDLATLLSRASKALEKGELDVAARNFEKAAELAPAHFAPPLGLADVRFQQGELFQALALARKARALAPEAPQPAVLLGRILVRLGAVTQALAAYEVVRKLDPKEAEGYLLAALLLRETGRREEAISLLESGLSHGVDAPELSEELSLQLLTTGNPKRARTVAELALENHPREGGLKLALGLALAVQPEERVQAAALLEEALDLGVPDPGRAHMELGQILLEIDKTDEALPHLREAVRLLPDLPAAHYRLGTALRRAGDLEGAKTELRQFQALSQSQDKQEWGLKEIDTQFNEAEELALDNRLLESLDRLNRLLDAHPDHARAQALRAKVLSSMGRYDDALEGAVRARELAPQMVEYHYLEGYLLVRMERYPSAAACLERALTLDPDLSEAHELLGVVAANENRNQEAVDRFERAIELGADSAALHLNLAQVLRKMGRLEESEEHMEAYRRLSQPQNKP